jgi:hypothetical protein
VVVLLRAGADTEAKENVSLCAILFFSSLHLIDNLSPVTSEWSYCAHSCVALGP